MRAYRSAIAERASEQVSTTHMSRHMRECGLIATLLMSLLALALLSRLALAQGASFHIVSDSKAKYSYTGKLSFNNWPGHSSSLPRRASANYRGRRQVQRIKPSGGRIPKSSRRSSCAGLSLWLPRRSRTS